jgi:glycosyltransferase involved in cell wall biosynthesis
MRKEPFIFAAGRLWDEAKNIGMLERVAPGLSWPVYVAGNSKHPSGALAQGNVHHFVRALGVLAPRDIASWLRRASIYALPARYEPFGLSVLEAALARCTLVLGDISSLREIWGDVAVFVPPQDEDVLRQAIEDLIADPQRREALAARARARALSFTPQRMAAEYVNAYSELIALRVQRSIRTSVSPRGQDLPKSEFVGLPQ